VIGGAFKAQLSHKIRLLWEDPDKIFSKISYICLFGTAIGSLAWLNSRAIIQFLVGLADSAPIGSGATLISSRIVSVLPGDYFNSSLLIASYCELFVISPLAAYLFIDYFRKKRSQASRKNTGNIPDKGQPNHPTNGRKKRCYLILSIPLLTTCWMLGIAFSYLVTLPAIIHFVFASKSLIPALDYIRVLIRLGFYTSLCFEIPAFLFLLAASRLTTWERMRRWWVRALVVSIVIAVLMVPDFEPISITIVSLLIYGVYWLGIAAARFGANKFIPKPGEIASN
jgi:Sec-independent protein secretion pathway component TatC